MREHAIDIWKAGVEAVKPQPLVKQALSQPSIAEELRRAKRILVLGGGKAGTAMAAAAEEALADQLDKVEGVVNVPADPSLMRSTRRIRLHAARPVATNHPTAEGVAGTQEILRLAREAGPDDVALCLISGGGSAILP